MVVAHSYIHRVEPAEFRVDCPNAADLKEGRTALFNTGIEIDTTQYWYEIKGTVQPEAFNDPNETNNTYSETIPPP